MELDAKEHIRKNLLKLLHEKAYFLNILDKVSICEGGSVGIAIYPNEYDKVQVVELFEDKYDEILYFGDKYEDNGNDFHLINHHSIIGHKIDDYNETFTILKQYL